MPRGPKGEKRPASMTANRPQSPPYPEPARAGAHEPVSAIDRHTRHLPLNHEGARHSTVRTHGRGSKPL
jgi:hypothetical protein